MKIPFVIPAEPLTFDTEDLTVMARHLGLTVTKVGDVLMISGLPVIENDRPAIQIAIRHKGIDLLVLAEFLKALQAHLTLTIPVTQSNSN